MRLWLQASFWRHLPATLASLKAAQTKLRGGVKPNTPATPQVSASPPPPPPRPPLAPLTPYPLVLHHWELLLQSQLFCCNSCVDVLDRLQATVWQAQ